ncbi:MAG: HNH endonuclease, partial [Actinobacteria bacterium]|nr:HNH endonuclease [Actinomycetota bacterium]
MSNGYKKKKNKRNEKSITYVNLMNFTCAFPYCESGLNVEGHHIIPLSKGGADAFWNIISLCFDCHRRKGLHRNW